MGEEFQPVYFRVMGRGVPKTPLSQLPKFNLDVIPPPPWLPPKSQPPKGRGRGRIIYGYSLESAQSDSGSNNSLSSTNVGSAEVANHYAFDQDLSSQNNEEMELILKTTVTEKSTKAADETAETEKVAEIVEAADETLLEVTALTEKVAEIADETPKITEVSDEAVENMNDQSDSSQSLKADEDDQSTIYAGSFCSTREELSVITDEKMNNLEKDLTENTEIIPLSSIDETLKYATTEVAHLNIPISPTSSQSFHSIENPSLSPESDEKQSKNNQSPNHLRLPGEEEEEEEEEKEDSDMEKHCQISPVDSSVPQSSSPTSDEIDFLDLAIGKKLNRFKKNNDSSESVPNFANNYYMSKKNASSRKQYNNVPKKNPQNSKKNRNNTSGGKKMKNNRNETDSSDSNEKALNRIERGKSPRHQQFAGYQDRRSPSPYHHLDPRSRYCNPIPKPQLNDQIEFPSLDAASNMGKNEQPKSYSSVCKQRTSLADLSSILSPLTPQKSSTESLSSDSSVSQFLEEYKVRETHSLSNSSNSIKFLIKNVTHERCQDNLREFLSQFGKVKMFMLVREGKVFTAYILMEFVQRDAFENLCSTIDGICATQFDPNHYHQDEGDYGFLKVIQQ